jgi:hypothetical protein
MTVKHSLKFALLTLFCCSQATACGEDPPAGTGGSGGASTTASSSATSTSSGPSDVRGCATHIEPDSSCTDSNVCTIDRCDIKAGFGVCVHEPYSPAAVCYAAPGDKSGDTFIHCSDGACCTTCLIDVTVEDPLSIQGKVDKFDGPCAAGNADDACGADGQICVDCKSQGKVCKNGVCSQP